MPYEVIGEDTVSIAKVRGVLAHPVTGEESYDVEEILYLKGDIIPDEDVAPYVVDAYDEGDDHIRSLISRTSKKATRKSDEDEEAPVGEQERVKTAKKTEREAATKRAAKEESGE
jgi:hypothetical protein